MTVIAVCNQKGGSGKTTMAINLAGAFAAEDKRVLLLDLDPQGSALDWGSINPDTMPQVAVAEIDRPQLLRQVRALRREYDVIVIDCRPSSPTAVPPRSALPTSFWCRCNPAPLTCGPPTPWRD